MLELSMTSFRYCQSPPIGFEHPDHVTYLHITTISQEKKSVPVLRHASPSRCRFGRPMRTTVCGRANVMPLSRYSKKVSATTILAVVSILIG
jgi:hypothetical protein